jgi:hypothetical protein
MMNLNEIDLLLRIIYTVCSYFYVNHLGEK